MNSDAFREYLTGLGLASGTIRMYRAQVNRALRWADENAVDLAAPSATELAALREAFVESASTLRQVRCGLQHYWDMLEVRQPPVKALRVPHKPRPIWRGIPQDQAAAMADAATGAGYPWDVAVLIPLYLGLRRTETAQVRWDRFSPGLDRYTVTGKYQATETLPVHSSLARRLHRYRTAFRWLFPGETRFYAHPSQVGVWVGEVAASVGLTVTPHQLRHTAINRVAKTEGVEAAQRFARHARLDTTQVYLEPYPLDELAAVVEEAFDWLGGSSDIADAA